MAIKKKGNVDFLRDTKVSMIDEASTSEDVNEEVVTTEVRQPEPKPVVKHKKDVNNWGRPRKLLIEGVKEKSITVQLPVNLIAAMRKEGRRTKKSMKEIIGEALLDKYGKLLK